MTIATAWAWRLTMASISLALYNLHLWAKALAAADAQLSFWNAVHFACALLNTQLMRAFLDCNNFGVIFVSFSRLDCSRVESVDSGIQL
jgi:hypothetical protein